jgi:hypothetical protein
MFPECRDVDLKGMRNAGVCLDAVDALVLGGERGYHV